MSNYATQSNVNGRFRCGTRIEVTGQSIKADNGYFEIASLFMAQPDGDSYYHWRRVDGRGRVSASQSTSACRSGRASKLEAMISSGLCRIVYEPSALVAVE